MNDSAKETLTNIKSVIRKIAGEISHYSNQLIENPSQSNQEIKWYSSNFRKEYLEFMQQNTQSDIQSFFEAIAESVILLCKDKQSTEEPCPTYEVTFKFHILNEMGVQFQDSALEQRKKTHQSLYDSDLTAETKIYKKEMTAGSLLLIGWLHPGKNDRILDIICPQAIDLSRIHCFCLMLANKDLLFVDFASISQTADRPFISISSLPRQKQASLVLCKTDESIIYLGMHKLTISRKII